MWQTFCNWLLYKKMGWTADVTEEHPDKYIICLAPHTSNWDFLIGQLYIGAQGMKSNFLMKKEWFFWPLGPIFRKMGGIPVWRSKKSSMTDNLAATARQERTFHLCITPEGTRSLNPEIISHKKLNYPSCSTEWITKNDISSAQRPLFPMATSTVRCGKLNCISRGSRVNTRRTSR